MKVIGDGGAVVYMATAEREPKAVDRYGTWGHIRNIASVSAIFEESCQVVFITFCVSRRRRKMYCGHARLCVCLSVCLSVRGHTPTQTRM